MTAELKQRIDDAVETCRAIQSFTAESSFADDSENLMLRSAVERQFEILGRSSQSRRRVEAGHPVFAFRSAPNCGYAQAEHSRL